MLKLIQDIIYDVTGKSGITDETDFVQDLALNSFDVMNIIRSTSIPRSLPAKYGICIKLRMLSSTWPRRALRNPDHAGLPL